MPKPNAYLNWFVDLNALTLILVALEMYIENAGRFDDPTIARGNIRAMKPLRDDIRKRIESQ